MMCKTAPDGPTGRITAMAPSIRMPTRIRIRMPMGMGMGMGTLIIGGRDSGSMGAAGMGDAAGAGRTGLLACPHQDGIISMMKAALWASAIASVLCVAVLAQGPPPPAAAGISPAAPAAARAAATGWHDRAHRALSRPVAGPGFNPFHFLERDTRRGRLGEPAQLSARR